MRTRNILAAGLALCALVACGSNPKLSALEIYNKPYASTMSDGHFGVTGNFTGVGVNRVPAQGQGVLMLKPQRFLHIELQLGKGADTTTLTEDLVVTATASWSRANGGAWTESGPPGVESWTLIGEDKAGVYDIKTSANGASTEEWIRAKDWYISKLVMTGSDGMDLTLSFDAYNTGAATLGIPQAQETA